MCKYIPTAGICWWTLISVNASNNPAYGKTAFISFAVPAGLSDNILSNRKYIMWCRGIFSIWISNLIERYTRRNTTCLMLVFVFLREPAGLSTTWQGILRCPFWQWHRSRIAQITCGGKLSNFEFSTYCLTYRIGTGLAPNPVPGER